MGDWVSAAIGAGSGLLSTIWNQYAPLSRTAKDAFSLQQLETMRQEQRQEDFFNKYQSIPAQVSQMQQAGINPALAAGGISAGSVPSSPSASSPQIDKADMSAILGQTLRLITELKDAKLERDLAVKQDDRAERLANAEIRLKNANAWKQEFENFHAEDLWSLDHETRVQALEIMKRNVSHLDNQLVQDTIGISKAKLEESLLTYQLMQEQFTAEHMQEIHDAAMALNRAEIALKESSTAENYAEIKQIIANTENLEQNTKVQAELEKKYGKEVALLAKDLEYQERTLNYRIDQAYYEREKTKADITKTATEARFYDASAQKLHTLHNDIELRNAVKYVTKAAMVNLPTK